MVGGVGSVLETVVVGLNSGTAERGAGPPPPLVVERATGAESRGCGLPNTAPRRGWGLPPAPRRG